MTSSGMKALDGIKVVDAASLFAGPVIASFLGDYGAEVTKIEHPSGDNLRGLGWAKDGVSLWWAFVGRNKRSVTCKLSTPEGRDLLKEIIKDKDVLIENFRPGTLEKWGIGPDKLLEINPGLVIARVSGYGQTGPYAERAGFASVSEAMGGIRYINGFPDEPPPRMHISLGDSLAGMVATQGILAALYSRRENGGKGQVVDVSLLESSFQLLESMIPEYDRCGYVRGPGGTGLAGVAPSNIFKSKDDLWMVIAANADGVYRRLCGAMGQPELADDPRFLNHLARGENQLEIERIIAEWAKQYTAEEIDEILNAAGVICGPIYTVADMFKDDHFWAREMLLKHEDPEIGEFVGPGIFPKFSETPGEVKWTGPWEEGSHNAEVYGELLGIDEVGLAALKEAGVL